MKEEVRRNAAQRIASGQPIVEGVLGYEDTVLPQLENALLAGHDIIFLGERGQAKTRIIRSLTSLLDEWMPIVAGSEILDDPYHPGVPPRPGSDRRAGRRHPDRLGPPRRALRREAGHARHLDRRPDRRGRPHQGGRGPLPRRRADPALRPGAADQPRHLRHQRAARPGRAHPGRPAQRARGARHPGPRLQDPPAARRDAGGLGQPRGLHQPGPHHHPAEGPLRRPDPHPLPARRRRPRSRSSTRRPCRSRAGGVRVEVPQHMVEIVATLSQLARQSPHINQRSGVSVRLSVANYETLVASAVRRALRLGETEAVPRISDLESLVASTSGKVEIETIDEGRDGQVVERIIQQAVLTVFKSHGPGRAAPRRGRRLRRRRDRARRRRHPLGPVRRRPGDGPGSCATS